jgi:hypothetical protein
MRLLLLITAFLSLSGAVWSQTFKAGLALGINGANVSGGESTGFRQLGLNAGPFIHYSINENAGIRGEILFSQKGAKKQIRPEIGDLSFYSLRLNYIEMPLLFTFDHNSFLFETGASTGYLINSMEEDISGRLNFQRPFNSLDFSGILGINYHFSDHFDMNWRISHSIIPVREHHLGSTFRLNRGQYNMALAFRLIYTI